MYLVSEAICLTPKAGLTAEARPVLAAYRAGRGFIPRQVF